MPTIEVIYGPLNCEINNLTLVATLVCISIELLIFLAKNVYQQYVLYYDFLNGPKMFIFGLFTYKLAQI